VSYPAIEISLLESQLCITIYNSDNSGIYKEYVVTASALKVVIDLTVDLAVTRPKEEITGTQFKFIDFGGGDVNMFSLHCINILSNFFISYAYED
jgi:hypothetical protein